MELRAGKNSGKIIFAAGSERTWLFFRNTAIFLGWVIGFLVCVRLVLVRSYNYDEISHAHMAWLLSAGQVPYRDFAINHLPFFWVILSPILKALPHAPVTLVVLRLGALLLNLVFVAALGALICMELKPAQRLWAAAGLGLFATNPLVVQYLIEFRPDALANGLLFTSLLWLSGSGSRNLPRMAVAGFAIGAALLVNTKYFSFPFILGVTALIFHVHKANRPFANSLGICVGFAIALAAGLITLSAIHVSWREAWSMVVEYNAAVEKMRPFGFGAAAALIASPFLLALGLLGILGYAITAIRGKIRFGPFEVAALIFLCLFLISTTRPWKQYAVSWFLLAALFPSRIGALMATRLRPATQFALAVGILMVTSVGFLKSNFSDPDATRGVSRADQDGLIRFCSQHLPAEDDVVAGFPLHPVFWRDSFFKVVIDMQSKGGDSIEGIVPKISATWPKERWESAGYEQELEARPPSLIVMPTLITTAQTHALSAYLKRHAVDYSYLAIPNTEVSALLRSDQAH